MTVFLISSPFGRPKVLIKPSALPGISDFGEKDSASQSKRMRSLYIRVKLPHLGHGMRSRSSASLISCLTTTIVTPPHRSANWYFKSWALWRSLKRAPRDTISSGVSIRSLRDSLKRSSFQTTKRLNFPYLASSIISPKAGG